MNERLMINYMRGRPMLLHLLVCIAMRYNSQKSLKITKAIYLLRFFNKTSASVLFLEFRYFKLQNSKFQYSVVS